MKVKLDKVCKRIYAGGDVPKDKYSTVMTSEYTVPIYANAEKDDGLYGYTDTARENELSITVAARGTIGFTAIRREPFLPVVRLITVVPDLSKVSERYLYYALKNCKPASSGTSIPQLTVPDIKKNEIELYSLPVQEKIADKLDVVVRIIALRQQELQRLDDLVKARFVEMFGNPISNPMKWDTYQLEECLERIDNGKSFICSDKPRVGDTPAILKLSAATYGDYRPNENKALLDESLFVESAEVHAGDLLFTRKNTPELVGTAAYVQNTPSKLMMPDLIFRLVPNEKVNAVFLWQLINCKEFRPVIQAISGGSAKSMSNISKERLGKIKVICPPRELQDSLIPFVEQTDKSKAVIQKALDETQLLFDSLMQQYLA